MTEKTYQYVLKGKEKDHTLAVAEEDFLINADGEIDYPIEKVLRKHQLAFEDLAKMEIQTIQFIAREGDKRTVLHEISLY